MTGELLFELLSEEIPARMQRRAIEDLVGLVRDKLAAADIVVIRSWTGSAEVVAKRFGVAPQTINKIRRGVLWKDVSSSAQ